MGDAPRESRHIVRMGQPQPGIAPAATPPLYQTAAFDVADLDQLEQINEQGGGYIYTRDNNPNHDALAASIAMLEGAEAGAVFASGMGALAAICLSLAQAGDQILMSGSLYGKTQVLGQRLQQLGIAVDHFDVTSAAELARKIESKTRLVLVETVANPLLEVADISGLAAVAGKIPLVVDSTFTTSELIRPLEHGAALVMHSASKYLNGHGDVLLGAVAGPGELVGKIRETASVFGQNANPFECWLVQRGLRTLPLRMQQICRTTRQLAEYLQGHEEVSRVWYPLLADHPSREVAEILYPQGTGGILTVLLRCDEGAASARVSRFMQCASGIPFSPTLADTRTTISHPARTSHRFLSAARRQESGITDAMVRISVGLEPAEMLMQELDRALRESANCRSGAVSNCWRP